LTLANFKRFESLKNLEFAPLTILTGPNSSGKSTIIQSLVLLKQSLEIPTALDALAFNDLVQLGSGQRVIRSDSGTSCFSIGLLIDMSSVAEPASKDLGVRLSTISVEWAFRVADSGTQIESIGLQGIDQAGKRYPLASVQRRKEAKAKERDRPTYTLSFENPTLRDGAAAFAQKVLQIELEPQPTVRLRKFIPEMVELKNSDSVHFVPLQALSPLFNYVLSILESALTRELHYIGPLRIEPSEMYAQNSRRIGVRGEDSIAFLRANAGKQVLHALPDGKSATLLEAVNAWLLQMEAGDDLEFSPLGDRFFEAKTGPRRLSEVGCGLGQVLPVLIQCLAASRGSIVLLEQPEIHLHQKLQANLADFLLQMTRRGVRIVAETHSELMIMRLRRRIAESPQGDVEKLLAVYFATAGSLTKIPFDDKGNVGLWPSSFFDQGLLEMRALAQAQSKRS
jgi:energy-coupling factor transporter ATP-binding protein EcfA2